MISGREQILVHSNWGGGGIEYEGHQEIFIYFLKYQQKEQSLLTSVFKGEW